MLLFVVVGLSCPSFQRGKDLCVDVFVVVVLLLLFCCCCLLFVSRSNNKHEVVRVGLCVCLLHIVVFCQSEWKLHL